MSALAVYLFRCENTELFALSLYRDPLLLPAGLCQGTWHFNGQLAMTSTSLASLPIDVAAAVQDLQRDGYAIVRLPSNLIIFPK